VLSLAGAGVGSFFLIWIVYEWLLPTRGALGFTFLWFAAFIALYAAITSVSNPMPVVIDRIAATVVQAGAAVVVLALSSAVIYTFAKGHRAIGHPNFFLHDMAGVGPQDPLNRGGIAHAIVGSLIEIGIAVCITLPLGVGAAVYMTEVGGRLSRAVRTVVEAMTALPSIVAGLFIYSTLIVKLGVPKSGFAASMALTVMMLPIIARSADVVLRVVPGGLRQAGLALGAPTWRVVWSVVLPTARSGLATALILGIARGVGETSPVLLTSGASTFFNHDPFSSPMNSLPLFIFSSVRSGETTYIERGFGAASVLLGLVLFLFIATRLLARARGSVR
jgi:phosphate transport system permease protein